jgi:hypothetical protein
MILSICVMAKSAIKFVQKAKAEHHAVTSSFRNAPWERVNYWEIYFVSTVLYIQYIYTRNN